MADYFGGEQAVLRVRMIAYEKARHETTAG